MYLAERKARDLTGEQFGRLTVVRYDHTDQYNNRYWLCHCICGEFKIVMQGNLLAGHTTSCGCYNKEHFERARGRHFRMYEFNGVRHSLTEWAKLLDMSVEALSYRLKKAGGDLEKACTKPLRSDTRGFRDRTHTSIKTPTRRRRKQEGQPNGTAASV